LWPSGWAMIVVSILCFIAYGIMGESENLALAFFALALPIVTAIVKTRFNIYYKSKIYDSPQFFQIGHRVLTIREGVPREIDQRELVRGDLIELTLGMQVPADLRIVYAHHLRIPSR
jgi:magnesium-transporting ATPase (P-type)